MSEGSPFFLCQEEGAARNRLWILGLRVRLRETPRLCKFDFSTHAREFDKTVLDSGFEVLDSGFFVSGTFWIPIVREVPGSLSCIPDYKAKDSGFRGKNMFESGFHQQKFPGFPDALQALGILFLFYFIFLRLILSDHVYQQPIIRTVNRILLVRDYQFC